MERRGSLKSLQDCYRMLMKVAADKMAACRRNAPCGWKLRKYTCEILVLTEDWSSMLIEVNLCRSTVLS